MPTHSDEAEKALVSVVERYQDQIKIMREALQIIAGERQCLDNLMSNADVAREALRLTKQKS